MQRWHGMYLTTGAALLSSSLQLFIFPKEEKLLQVGPCQLKYWKKTCLNQFGVWLLHCLKCVLWACFLYLIQITRAGESPVQCSAAGSAGEAWYHSGLPAMQTSDALVSNPDSWVVNTFGLLTLFWGSSSDTLNTLKMELLFSLIFRNLPLL